MAKTIPTLESELLKMVLEEVDDIKRTVKEILQMVRTIQDRQARDRDAARRRGN